MKFPISPFEIVQIAAAIPVSPKTVERVYGGAGSVYSRERVLRKARELGLALPPPLAERHPGVPVAITHQTAGLRAHKP